MVGAKIMKELWEVDINKYYYIDDDDNIWETEEEFIEHHFDEYTGTKDNYEEWCTELITEHDLKLYKGMEILHKYITDLEETIDVYRERLNN